MLAITEFEPFAQSASQSVNWQGRSGRFYALSSRPLADFALSNSELCLITDGRNVLWVGSASEVIGDQSSRARFRLALDCADRAFILPAPSDEVTRMTLIWDLEGAAPVAGLTAA
jgi:hypothetical protein